MASPKNAPEFSLARRAEPPVRRAARVRELLADLTAYERASLAQVAMHWLGAGGGFVVFVDQPPWDGLLKKRVIKAQYVNGGNVLVSRAGLFVLFEMLLERLRYYGSDKERDYNTETLLALVAEKLQSVRADSVLRDVLAANLAEVK